LGQWSFTQRVVDGVKYVQTIDIHYSTNDDGITEIEDLTVFIGEGWPCGEGRAVWISGLRKVDPIIGHLFVFGWRDSLTTVFFSSDDANNLFMWQARRFESTYRYSPASAG
jgi:hypothetical protein